MKVLFSAYTGLGNFILKTPAINSLRRSFPGVEIDLLVGRGFGAELILKHSDWIENLQSFQPNLSLEKKIKFLLHLKNQKYDLIILPFDACHFFILIGAFLFPHCKVVFHQTLKSFSLKGVIFNILNFISKERYVSVPMNLTSHEIDLNYDLIERILSQPINRSYDTSVFFAVDDSLDRFNLRDSPYLVLQPSAANGCKSPKVWDPKNFYSLMVSWRELFPEYKVVLVGDKGDAESLRNEKYFNDDSVINLLGKTNFNELCNVVAGSSIVVAHDSGVMHIANALRRPLLALYGPTNYLCTGPIGERTKVLFSKHPTSQIMSRSKLTEAQLSAKYPNYECMSGLAYEDVLRMLVLMHGENYAK
ncbi:glycosyltransferase family 9 protein [Polynucleobacter paneuropaeus]|nr:glycosyltransferase family 9 protein [Polynucleobacter paneuropaeus]